MMPSHLKGRQNVHAKLKELLSRRLDINLIMKKLSNRFQVLDMQSVIIESNPHWIAHG